MTDHGSTLETVRCAFRLANVALTAVGLSGSGVDLGSVVDSDVDSDTTVLPPVSCSAVASEESAAVGSAVSTFESPAPPAASESLLLVFD
ncbi:hypothetical protein BQ8420_29420 [Nocardiopsis sp. JB363]|nr:hypothetical protein BQ8420_29420 [Nocardiopsis sp. JB363]